MKNKFQSKKILVAGGTGLVGQQLTRQLVDLGAEVYVCSLDSDDMAPKGIKDYYKLDMSVKENCKKACEGKNIVLWYDPNLEPLVVTKKNKMMINEEIIVDDDGVDKDDKDDGISSLIFKAVIEEIRKRNARNKLPCIDED